MRSIPVCQEHLLGGDICESHDGMRVRRRRVKSPTPTILGDFEVRLREVIPRAEEWLASKLGSSVGSELGLKGFVLWLPE